MSFLASYNVVDLFAVGLLGLCIIIGVFRGFISDFFGLFTWISAALVTNLALPYVRPLGRQLIHATFIADIITAFACFILILILCVFLVKSLARLVHAIGLAGLDRTLGIFSGLFRGTVILTVLYMGALMFWKPGEKNPQLRDARIEPYLAQTTRLAQTYIIPPDFFPKRIRDHLTHQEHKPVQTSEQLVRSLSSPRPAATPEVETTASTDSDALTLKDVHDLGRLVHKVVRTTTP